jgi:predicted O-linked N-acetylglucosamine transferase (SPINDLY family)
MTAISEALAMGLRHHQRGELQQAEQKYRQILQMDPHHVHALHFLGVLALQVGSYDLAVGHFGEALRLKPDYAEAHNNLGIALAAQRKFDEAVASYQQALRVRPNFAEAHNSLGVALAAQKKFAEAVESYQQALQFKPDYAEAHCNMGSALGKQGKLDEAVVSCRHALRLKPNYPDAHNTLGNVLAAQGKLDEAVASFQQAVRLMPAFAEAGNNLGVALAAQDKLDEAVASFQQALHFQPNHVEARNNLGAALREQGKLHEASAHCLQALRLRPDYAEAHFNLGVILQGQGKPDDAAASFQQALRVMPDYAEALYSLGEALREQGKLEEAAANFKQALSLKPDCARAQQSLRIAFVNLRRPDDGRQAPSWKPSDRLRISSGTLLPPIYNSMEDLHDWRKRLTENIRQLREDRITQDLTCEPAMPLFFLAYQGLNDRDIQREMACIYSAPRNTAPAPGGGQPKIQVGFLSCHLKQHTIGHLMRGLIANLSRKDFSVTVLSAGRNHDGTVQFIRQHADRYVELPQDLEAARRVIAQQGLDVLFYTDIGMDPTAYSLAFSRLAPVQCVTWGHPSTTGINTIDYFLSSELLESDQAEQHYTETLVRLKSLPIYYYRPALPSPVKDRAYFGLDTAAHVYACPQSLFKFHPDFDEILGSVLRADPLATIVLIHGRSRHWDELLVKRFSRTIPDVLERIRFLPPQPRDDFLSLNAVADVLLDPVHFGGGNTTYEGLALGIPIVTLPSPLLRGRITLALYKQMGMLDCVVTNAAEYIKLAVKLGTDPDYRAMIRSKILAANEVLYENPKGVRELEQFFQHAVDRARSRR